MAILIRTNGTLEEITTMEVKDISLEALRKLVGGFVEIVSLENNSGHCLYVNEDAKLKQLPTNWVATAIKYGAAGGGTLFIAGDVVYASPVEIDLDGPIYNNKAP